MISHTLLLRSRLVEYLNAAVSHNLPDSAVVACDLYGLRYYAYHGTAVVKRTLYTTVTASVWHLSTLMSMQGFHETQLLFASRTVNEEVLRQAIEGAGVEWWLLPSDCPESRAVLQGELGEGEHWGLVRRTEREPEMPAWRCNYSADDAFNFRVKTSVEGGQ